MIPKAFPRLIRRFASNSSNQPQQHEAWLFVDSVFPIQLARWDFRHYIGAFKEERLLSQLKSRLANVKTHDFEVLSLEPHKKDGGVFVRFKFTATQDEEQALQSIQSDLQEEAGRERLPSWLGLHGGNIWLVKGSPWREDMNRFASPIVKVSFDGPDVQEQLLYQVLRPFGKIEDLTYPGPVPAGTPRSCTVTFQRLHSATVARNAVHGLVLPSSTRLRTAYQQPIPAHALRDWMSAHPKIMLPIVVFLLGSLTYTVFDPIRALVVKAKMLRWFDYRELSMYKWLRENVLGGFSFTAARDAGGVVVGEGWQERKEAEGAMRSYLLDPPSTIAFVHGPQGSGKSRLLETILNATDRAALFIDCKELQKASSDSQLVVALARQTGYWPVFTFLNSMNTLIDLASVGLIGQKAGLSSSVTDQLQQILEVVGKALQGVSASRRAGVERAVRAGRRAEARAVEEARRAERIRRGVWHDGRLDCVAGNGVMSELGVGDEVIEEEDGESVREGGESVREGGEDVRQRRNVEDVQRQRSVEDVRSLPIVVIRNYSAKGATQEESVRVLARWAAAVVENQIAHVIVLSDNRENAKWLTNALPTKPLNSIAFYDADAASALSFVEQKLRDVGVGVEMTPKQRGYVEQLGGRASDLENLVHKVRSGKGVEDAVGEIIDRDVGELRKNAFGDDVEGARGLAWTREQAWAVLKVLAKQAEVAYYSVLLEFPFKGDEGALKGMERAELISIGTLNGRPSVIRPGKPVYRYVFERLVQDPVFYATQEIASNEKVIASAESTVRACEEELLAIREVTGVEVASRWWWGGESATGARAEYLFGKMGVSGSTIRRLEARNGELRKVLAMGR